MKAFRSAIPAWVLPMFLVCHLVTTPCGGRVPPDPAPIAETGAANALGTEGMTANGRVHPRGLFTEYYFEYGLSPEYGGSTPAEPLGPRLAAHYQENWDEGTGGWRCGMDGRQLEHFPEGGASGGFIRYTEPSGLDHNHDDGIGTLTLAKYLGTGVVSPGVFLGGGVADLRDARVSIRVRGRNWRANGSELIWWVQSQINPERLHQPGWRRANWAHTGYTLTDLLDSGEWETAEYRLVNDAEQWTYAGNNLRQENPERYAYWPLHETLRQANCNMFHLLAFVDPDRPPSGSIDFDAFELVYRNHSLLLPSNGGVLVGAPPGDDPAALTDGRRHGEGHMWRSLEGPIAPLDFVYAFRHPVTIQAIQLHQHTDWPSKEVEVLASVDGESFTTILSATLPGPDVRPPFSLTLERDLSVEAHALKVRILSGYRSAYWGLGEIEVFGRGAVMLPDDDWHHVHMDIGGLEPGARYHYRLVAVNEAGVFYGEDRTFMVPADKRPRLTTGPARRITASNAVIECRLNPRGEAAEYWVEYGTERVDTYRTPPAYGGLLHTPRTVFIPLAPLLPATEYRYRPVARNAAGITHGREGTLKTAAMHETADPP